VVGADKWRNPDEDLPQDFAERREENYRELRKPLDAAVFIDELREQMNTELTLLNDRMPKLTWLDISQRKSGAIRLTPTEAQPEPKNLRRVKGEVQRRWGIVPLIDMLKEAVLRTGCLDAVTSVSGGGSLPAEVLAERLLLVIYAYGTNTGIKAVASGGHGHTEDELRYVRRRYLSAEAAQADQQGEAVPAGGRGGGRLPAARAGADPADPLGADRPAVRPDDQVRDRDPDADRVQARRRAYGHVSLDSSSVR
jgi:hypothetical protein